MLKREVRAIEHVRFRDGRSLIETSDAPKMTEPDAETSTVHETHKPKGSMNSIRLMPSE